MMPNLSRVFSSRQPVQALPARVQQVAAAVPGRARPLRTHVYREGCITSESGYRRRGVVMDFTDAGLRMRFPTNELLPSVVTVNARAVGLSGEADVIWQKHSEVGLRLRK